MRTPSQEAASWLQYEIEKRGWRRSHFARLAEVSPSTVTHALQAEKVIGEDFARRIAQALSMPVDEVFAKVGIFDIKRLHTEEEELIVAMLREIPREGREVLIAQLKAASEIYAARAKSALAKMPPTDEGSSPEGDLSGDEQDETP